MTNKPIMHATDLSRHYRQGDVTLSVLSGVNLSIEAGEKVAIVGVSGSGKTTLAELCSAGWMMLIPVRSFLAGQSWHDLGPSERAAWRNQHVGFVYQFHHLLGEFSALENVAMPLLIGSCSPTEARCRATQLLERVGLGDRLHHQPAELSGGERQRVAVARALVTEPSVVLMDEPTGNLDPHTAGAILNLLIELNESLNISFILVTHDPVIAAQMDRTLTLTDGLLVSENPAVV